MRISADVHSLNTFAICYDILWATHLMYLKKMKTKIYANWSHVWEWKEKILSKYFLNVIYRTSWNLLLKVKYVSIKIELVFIQDSNNFIFIIVFVNRLKIE